MLHPRSHDYEFLIRRWRKIARHAGLRMQPYAESGGYTLHVLESTARPDGKPSVYLSAGIHGDESAATEGLISWIESDPAAAKKFHLLIFPCLNPWGLVNNSRLDSAGRDLNRAFNNPRVPQIRAQVRLLARRHFDLALTLHEDYDARGIYIYEVKGSKPFWAEDLLAAASPHVPVDSRRTIESRPAKNGIVRRAITPDLIPTWPEAFLLHFQHATRTFTIETPSEFDLTHRVAAQIAVIQSALHLLKTTGPWHPHHADVAPTRAVRASRSSRLSS